MYISAHSEGTFLSVAGEFGVLAEPGVVLTNRGYHWVRGSCVALLDLSVRRLDHPDSHSLGARRVFGDLLKLVLHSFGAVWAIVVGPGRGSSRIWCFH